MIFERIVRGSLRNRGLVILAWALLALVGASSLARLPLDAFPDTTPVQVQVNTRAAGMGPEQTEQQITWPLEQVLSGLPDLAEVRSLSTHGLSQLTLVFDDGADVWRARQAVAERIATVALPPDIERPQLGPVATGLGEVFHYVLRSDQHDATELRSAQDWILAPQLRAVPGVAQINSWGGDEQRVEVQVDPVRLDSMGLTLTDLTDALQAANRLAGGGRIDRDGASTLVQGVGLLHTLDDVRSVQITTRDGVPVRIGDVAQVVQGRSLRQGAVTADGRGEVVLGLGFMLLGGDSAEVSRRLSVRLTEAASSLPEGMSATPVYQRTELVDHVLDTVKENLVVGALLVVVVLLVFLGDLRAGLVVATVIPLSLLFAANGLLALGIAGSLMSLGALDFGLIVDSSIVQVENAVRRLGESPEADPIEVVATAALEVRKPTLYGELVIASVYLPVLALQGTEGKLFAPMALTVLLALLGSLLASLTLVPVLTSLWVRPGRVPREGLVVRWAQAAYRPVLRRALGAPWLVLSVAGLLLLDGLWLGSQLGTQFVPRLSEGAVVINTVRLAGVSLDESVRIGTRVEQLLLDRFPAEIEHVWTRTGTAEVATDPMGIELSDVFVTLTPRSTWTRATHQDELVQAMEAELSTLPGMNRIFTQPIEMRVNEMIAGVRADLGIKLFGDDLEELRRRAVRIADRVRTIDGAADVRVEQLTGQPVLQATLDRDALARQGLPARDVLQTVEALTGLPAGQLVQGDRRVPVAVRIADDWQRHPDQLGELPVLGPGGQRVPLQTVTTLTLQEGPSSIQREWGKRRIVVSANVRGRDLGSFVDEVRAEVDALPLPTGWFVRYGGQFEHYERARDRLLWVVPLALGLVALLLYATYGRLLDAVRVFTGVPFAAVGGVAALWLRGLPLSVSAAVGFVALSGVAVLADMVLVSTIRRHLAAGLPAEQAVQRAATERLRPVLMTSLVAALGFLPMALHTGVGAEVQRPLATVVIGGLFSSTLLTLVVLPVLYTLTGRSR